MSDETRRSYTGREIVLELFPATPERLVPRTARYRLEGDPDESGTIVRDRADGRALLRLAAVERRNRRTVPMVCDLCQHAATSRELRFLRAEVPFSEGRRWRYVAACVDVDACDARRLDDEPIERLLRRA